MQEIEHYCGLISEERQQKWCISNLHFGGSQCSEALLKGQRQPGRRQSWPSGTAQTHLISASSSF